MLYSHYDPDILLSEHVSQVVSATRAILANHSLALQSKHPEIAALSEFVARMHDTGKASQQFQAYIRNPAKYKGNKKAKAHTAPSTFMVWAETRQHRHDPPLQVLATALAVAGHHQGLHTQEELTGQFLDQGTADFLHAQISTMPLDELCASVGLELTLPDASGSSISALLDYLEDELLPILTPKRLPLAAALDFRIMAQLLLSILLEADKAFLAISEPYQNHYANAIAKTWPPGLVTNYLTQQKQSAGYHERIDVLRSQVQEKILEKLSLAASVQSLTLPTGMGKTMAAAGWAFSLWNKLPPEARPKRIILVLPFLSIIDQTVHIYQKMLADSLEPDTLLTSHSLADRVYDDEINQQDPDANDFFIDTWHAAIVITTFDQFLLALMDNAARYQMRFHNLCDALIVLDEIQAMPCKLWHPLDHMLQRLADRGNSHILAMSATQPGFLTSAQEIVDDPARIFAEFHRYRLVLRCRDNMPLARFVEEISERSNGWHDRRVLITLNTRKSARTVLDALCAKPVGQELICAGSGTPLYFLTADVIPAERLDVICKIRAGKLCVVVSTQCIEAGVDIDMDLIIRDFAPLDALVQIAGRCNRNDTKPRCDVEIVRLENERGSKFCGMIYDKILLQETERILAQHSEINEENIFAICRQYFQAVSRSKNLGEELTQNLAYLQKQVDVHGLLRGKEKKIEFLVISQKPELQAKLEAALAIEDRWQRRRELRKLSGEISRYSVSIFASVRFDPNTVATPLKHFWLLQAKHYVPYRGLQINVEDETCTQIF